jgi:predicted enzyme related to lactoylglutathione lyase
MGERTSYTPGTFCWADLSTTDQEGAKAFYSALFGWEIEDMPVGDDSGTVYSMATIGGKTVGAISPQPDQQRQMGIPPLWNSYVSVEDADTVANRAGELGATVHMPPFDVMDVGRMTVIQDPQGAFFMLWQPRRHIGAGLVNAPGAMTWNELASTDLDGSKSFYGDLFGWEIEEVEGSSMGTYLSIKNGAANNGGMREVMPPGTPPHWAVYFGTDDVEASLAKVEELGGTKMMGPMEIGMGKIGFAQDPQGAVFALFEGQMEP